MPSLVTTEEAQALLDSQSESWDMGGSEFLRRLQPLKADMEAAYFRVYQPFHVREEDFDALLALLDEQAQKRTLNLQRTDRQTPWFKQGPAGMRFVYSDAQTPAQVHARAQELKELGVGWVLFSDVPYPYTESLRQTLRQRIDLWHEEGLAVGVDLMLPARRQRIPGRSKQSRATARCSSATG